MAYNNYRKDSEAWQWFEFDVKPALKKLADAESEIEGTMESLCDQIDEMAAERDSEIEEKEHLEKQVEDLEAELDDLRVDKDELINLLSKLMIAGEEIREFCNKTLVKMGALNETIDSDDSNGADGDGSGQDNSGQSDGEASTGVTRPQIP